jgi:hypothetical protein
MNDMMYGGMGSSSLVPGSMRHDLGPDSVDEELIPTAIVIKNIPFAVKKEALVELMTRLGLPLPYAFNYHFDNGVFRGLAFANFTSAEETAHVIAALNHYDLHGRKLRVEYKKMLPLAERERIEREKRERRGQLEEQHRPVPASTLNQAPSMSSLSNHIPATSPSPVSARGGKPGMPASYHPQMMRFADVDANWEGGTEVDMNDPQVLQFYSQLLLFKEDVARESMTFPSSITPAQRRIIHTLSHQLGLVHISKGTGDQRQVHVFRVQGGSGAPNNMSPPLPQMHTGHAIDPQRRSLNRAATTDFSDVRGADMYGLGRQGSGYLGFPESPGGLAAAANLRAAKSYADLRSVTPSPVPSTASFPATLQSNYRQFGDLSGLGQTNASNPTLAPTANTNMVGRDELSASGLANGFGNLNIGTNFGNSSPSRGLRGFASWEREAPGPIGGHRSFSTNYDDQGRERNQAIPSRQPRGPVPERGNGFSRARQNGHAHRGSDELSQQSGVEIVVEQ